MKLINEKGVIETSSPIVEHISPRNTNYDPSYPSSFTRPQATCPPSTLSTGVNTYPYTPPPIRKNLKPTLFVSSSGAGPTDPMIVPNLYDPKKWEKLKQEESSNKQQKYNLLKERLKAIEGINILDGMDAAELSLVQDLVILSKFKILDFEKYDGTKCLVAHLIMYCRKMAMHIDNDKLLIHYFQDSLIRVAT